MLIDEQAIRQQAIKDGQTHFATGIAVVKNSKVLIVKRSPDDYLGGNYELPGGGVEAEEDFITSAKRELLEETGLECEIIGSFPGFDYETGSGKKVRQINLIATTEDDKVQLNPSEHSEYKWVDHTSYQDLPMTKAITDCLDQLFKTELAK